VIRVAIETATSAGSVAVARGDRVLAEVALGEQRRHAEAILPALETAVSRAGLDRRDIEEVVVGAGPGSFTGVRVAAATAKGLAAALSVPLVAYSSLLALAAAGAAASGGQGEPGGRPICALFDARRGEVYAGCWRVGVRGVESLMDPRVGPVASVIEATRSWTPRPVFAGDGARRYAHVLPDDGADPGAPSHPRASTLLWLAAHHRAAGEVEDGASWEPLYVRGSSAERGIAG
jgi:tRNA threonylcarbamoyladenosine biosynthesis protein TsaB